MCYHCVVSSLNELAIFKKPATRTVPFAISVPQIHSKEEEESLNIALGLLVVLIYCFNTNKYHTTLCKVELMVVDLKTHLQLSLAVSSSWAGYKHESSYLIGCSSESSQAGYKMHKLKLWVKKMKN